MKFVYYIQTEIFLKLKMIYLNRFYKYPCSFESFLNNLNLNLQKSWIKAWNCEIESWIELTKLTAWQFHNN